MQVKQIGIIAKKLQKREVTFSNDVFIALAVAVVVVALSTLFSF